MVYSDETILKSPVLAWQNRITSVVVAKDSSAGNAWRPSPEIYLHEWTSFSTKHFPENKEAKTGEIVRIVTREFKSGTPAEDILCTSEAYRATFDECGLRVLAEENGA